MQCRGNRIGSKISSRYISSFQFWKVKHIEFLYLELRAYFIRHKKFAPMGFYSSLSSGHFGENVKGNITVQDMSLVQERLEERSRVNPVVEFVGFALEGARICDEPHRLLSLLLVYPSCPWLRARRSGLVFEAITICLEAWSLMMFRLL